MKDTAASDLSLKEVNELTELVAKEHSIKD